MNRLSISTLILFILIPSLYSNGSKIKPELILGSIHCFYQSPLSSQGLDCLKVVIHQAQHRDDYLISLEGPSFSWIKTHQKEKNVELLVGAYICGNFEYQLKGHGLKGAEKAGFRQLFRIYSTLKHKKAISEITEIEEILNNLDPAQK